MPSPKTQYDADQGSKNEQRKKAQRARAAAFSQYEELVKKHTRLRKELKEKELASVVTPTKVTEPTSKLSSACGNQGSHNDYDEEDADYDPFGETATGSSSSSRRRRSSGYNKPASTFGSSSTAPALLPPPPPPGPPPSQSNHPWQDSQQQQQQQHPIHRQQQHQSSHWGQQQQQRQHQPPLPPGPPPGASVHQASISGNGTSITPSSMHSQSRSMSNGNWQSASAFPSSASRSRPATSAGDRGSRHHSSASLLPAPNGAPSAPFTQSQMSYGHSSDRIGGDDSSAARAATGGGSALANTAASSLASADAATSPSSPTPPLARSAYDPMCDYWTKRKIGEGAYGEVFEAIHRPSGEKVALKEIKVYNSMQHGEGVSMGVSLDLIREIKFLTSLSAHREHFVTMLDALFDMNGNVVLVFEYMDADIYGMLSTPGLQLSDADTRCLLHQILQALATLHDAGIMHRDCKASNLLINRQGQVKLADFGLATNYSQRELFGCNVVTLWYRAPELLLGDERYGPAVDMWAAGCIFHELRTLGKSLFRGRDERTQLDAIFQLVGTPTAEVWPEASSLPGWTPLVEAPAPGNRKPPPLHPNRLTDVLGPLYDEDSLALLRALLSSNPKHRLTAHQALDHRYFTGHSMSKPSDLPQFEAIHDFEARRRRRQHRAQSATAAAASSASSGQVANGSLDTSDSQTMVSSASQNSLLMPGAVNSGGSSSGKRLSDPDSNFSSSSSSISKRPWKRTGS